MTKNKIYIQRVYTYIVRLSEKIARFAFRRLFFLTFYLNLKRGVNVLFSSMHIITALNEYFKTYSVSARSPGTSRYSCYPLPHSSHPLKKQHLTVSETSVFYLRFSVFSIPTPFGTYRPSAQCSIFSRRFVFFFVFFPVINLSGSRTTPIFT